MNLAIGTSRIDAPEIPAYITQVGMSRVGARVTPRTVVGRFVALRHVVATTVEPVEYVKLPNPVRVLGQAPLARAVVSLALLVVSYRALGWQGTLLGAWALAMLAAAKAIRAMFVPTSFRGREIH